MLQTNITAAAGMLGRQLPACSFLWWMLTLIFKRSCRLKIVIAAEKKAQTEETIFFITQKQNFTVSDNKKATWLPIYDFKMFLIYSSTKLLQKPDTSKPETVQNEGVKCLFIKTFSCSFCVFTGFPHLNASSFRSFLPAVTSSTLKSVEWCVHWSEKYVICDFSNRLVTLKGGLKLQIVTN